MIAPDLSRCVAGPMAVRRAVSALLADTSQTTNRGCTAMLEDSVEPAKSTVLCFARSIRPERVTVVGVG
jgi:hypothetical protein